MPRESQRTTEFGILLTQLRKLQNYTQAELGSLASVTAGYICLLETGQRNPGPRIIRKLSGALDVQPTVLLISASINTFDFASTLRDDSKISAEEANEYKFVLTASERIQVQIYIDFLKYTTAINSIRTSG